MGGLDSSFAQIAVIACLMGGLLGFGWVFYSSVGSNQDSHGEQLQMSGSCRCDSPEPCTGAHCPYHPAFWPLPDVIAEQQHDDMVLTEALLQDRSDLAEMAKMYHRIPFVLEGEDEDMLLKIPSFLVR